MTDKLVINRRDTLALIVGATAASAFGGRALAAEATLSFWATHTGTPELKKAMQGLCDAFGKEKGVKVNYQPVDGTMVYPKFLTAAEGQALPDVADGWSYHPLQFAAMGQMEPTDDIIEAWKKSGQLADIVNDYAYKKFFWNGHYWAIPWNLDARAIYYRKDLLEAAGLKEPTNWDEFTQATIKLNDPDNGVYGYAFPAGVFSITQHFYMMVMLQAGGSILGKDGSLVFGTTAKDANVKALQWINDFYAKYHVTPEGIASYNTDDSHNLFLQGRAAFAFGTGQLISRLLAEQPDLVPKTGVLQVLQGPGAKLIAGFYNPLFIWNKSPQIKLAKEFASWLVEPGRLQPIYKAYPGASWPVLKSEFSAPVFSSSPLLQEMVQKVVPYTTDFAYPSTGVPQMGAIDGQNLFAEPVNDVIAGTKTPEQAVADAHAKMAKLWS
jgi:multiple sugar transport system substrate-binding protein